MRFTSRGIGILMVCIGSAAASAAPITSFTYAYDSAGHQPNAGLYPDSSGNELNDNAFINPGHSPIYQEPGWVGIDDTAFPADSGLAHPQVNIAFDTDYSLSGLTITYLVDTANLVAPPDQLTLTFSDDGVVYGSPQVFTVFPVTNNPGINTATFALGGQAAQCVRAAFLNDVKWTFLGELDFDGGPVPEPASAALMLGAAGVLLVKRR
jgi:hypothetical protein